MAEPKPPADATPQPPAPTTAPVITPAPVPVIPQEKPEPSLDELKAKLELKQAKFCELYVGPDRDYYGNGTRCYAVAYGYDLSRGENEHTCAEGAYRLLKDADVCRYMRALMVADKSGWNDEHVDNETLFLINQHVDFGAKARAIAEYNKVRQRVNRFEFTGKGGAPLVPQAAPANLSPVTTELLEKLVKLLEKK